MSAHGGPWDLVVIGGGTAGIVGSRIAATLGARVLLVERARPGGDCLWTGCVPSKALLAAAHAVGEARRAPRLGVTTDARVDFAEIMRHVRSAIAAIEPVDSAETLRGHGVVVRTGTARFTGPATLEVDGEPVPFRAALVATGSAPAVPHVPGLDQVAPLTSDTVWDLTALPGRLLVLGGGGIGCELAQAFARLGSRVTLVEAEPRILAGEDEDASAVVRRALEQDGVTIRAGTALGRVSPADGGGVTASLSSGETVSFDAVLVAAGRRPRTDELGLDRAGVEVAPDGTVLTDRAMRTSNPRIVAAGDVTDRADFTHTAGVDAGVAASNVLLGLRRRVDEVVPRVTFTDPELAAVGVPTVRPDRAPRGRRMVTRRHDEVDRAVAEARTEGFTRLALGPRGRVLGATTVGPRAGETLAEVTLAVRKGLTAADLTASIHPYPTYGDGVWNAAIDVVQEQLAAASRLTGALVRARGAWRDRRRGTG